MKKKVLWVIIVLLFTGLSTACSKRKAEASFVDASASNALFLHSYFFDNDCILSSSSYYIKSDYTDGFNLICDDLFCNHMDEKCAAYESGIDSAVKSIWDNICFKYNDALYFLISYDGQVIANEDEYKATFLYYTDLYKADLNGKNRKLIARIPLRIRQKMSFSSIAIDDDILWIGGVKEKIWTLLNEETAQKEKNEIVCALYSVNLDDCSTYEALTDIVPSDTTMQMVVSKDAVVFANRYVLSDGKTNQDRVYFYLKDDNRHDIIPGEELVTLLGAQDEYLYYCKNQEIVKYNLKTGQNEVMCDDCYIGMTCMAEGIVIINSDGIYELIGYDGKRETRTWNTSYQILAEVGDKLIALKNMDLYWVKKDEVEDIDERAVLIGPFGGLVY